MSGLAEGRAFHGRAHSPRVTSALNAFRRILQSMRLASMEVQNKAGLSAAQLFVLHQLSNGSGLSINELAELTMTDRSSVAEVVDRLAHRRLVRRDCSPQDRRRAEVTITPAGGHALERAPAPPAVWLVSALERLPAEKLEALATSLELLTTELGIQDSRPVMFDGDKPDRKGTARRRTARSPGSVRVEP